MEVVFADEHLAAVDAGTASLGLGQEVDEDFRQLIAFILEAADERDIRAMRSLHYEKLKDRGGAHSLRIHGPWRLIFRLEDKGPSKKFVVVGVEDYH